MRSKAVVKTAGLAAAGVMGLWSLSAHAITWDFSSFSQGGTNANNYSNTYSATSGTTRLTVSAFSTTGASGAFETANIGNFGSGSGFGVRNRIEGLGVNSPNHSMDNNGNTDVLALNFTNLAATSQVAVVIDSLMIGWRQTDSDLSLLRWTGATGPTITGGTISSLLTAGWSLVNNYADLAEDTYRNTGATASSSWWLVSAYNSAWGTGTNTADLSDGNDYMKFLKEVSSTPRPPNEVPEPGSMALLALGIAGLAIMRRRSS